MTANAPLPPARVVRLPGGVTAREDGDGLHAWLPSIKSVGIANLAAVKSHHIASAFGSASHVVQFAAGGELRFAYSSAGTLLELSGEGLSFQVKPDGEVLFGPCTQRL